jgi:hypothetical protein
MLFLLLIIRGLTQNFVCIYIYMQEHAMPRHPTLRALIRACTISFGSICVGSLFVSIVQTLHAIVSDWQQAEMLILSLQALNSKS